MLEIGLHIVEQFDWNSVKEALYVTGPLLAVLLGVLTGLINPLLGIGVGILLDMAFKRISFSTVGDLGEVITGIPEVGTIGSGIEIWKAMAEMWSRAMEVGMSKNPSTFPEPDFFPLPETWRPPVYNPVYNKWPFPDSGDAIPTTIPKTEPDIFKNTPWVPDMDKALPNWRNMSLEEIAKALNVSVEELLSMLGLKQL